MRQCTHTYIEMYLHVIQNNNVQDITCIATKNQCPVIIAPDVCANLTNCATCTNRGCTWQESLGKTGECTPACALKVYIYLISF